MRWLREGAERGVSQEARGDLFRVMMTAATEVQPEKSEGPPRFGAALYFGLVNEDSPPSLIVTTR